MTGTGDTLPTIDTIYRAEFGRIVAGLTRRFGDLSLAEEMAQEAFTEAVRRWPEEGVPPRPAAWLTVTARNKALDRVRRESTRDSRHEEAHMLYAHEDPESTVSSVPDDRLRLLFTCCHPALGPSVQVALTLRLLGGLTVPEIAHAFLVPERTMAQRITRAKRKISDAHIPYRVPRDSELPARLGGVLATLYLIYNEGYLGHGDDAVRADLSLEAIRLTRVLRTLMPDEPEILGLLALMLLSDARRPARVREGDGTPRLVPLDQQDRRLWDRSLVAEGHELVRACLRRNRPGQYQLLAAINAVHTDAVTFDDTDWAQIRVLYDQLYAATPTPVVALNRAVAVAEVDGAAEGLRLVEEIDLPDYAAYHAIHADLLRRMGRGADAASAYDRAVELATNPAERDDLARRRAALA